MKSFKITTLPGDGIGPEVMDAALAILGLVGSEYELNFEIITELAGGASFDKFNEPITESALQSCLESDAVLLGAVGGPKWDNLPQNKKPEKGLLKLREVLGLFFKSSPCKNICTSCRCIIVKKRCHCWFGCNGSSGINGWNLFR